MTENREGKPMSKIIDFFRRLFAERMREEQEVTEFKQPTEFLPILIRKFLHEGEVVYSSVVRGHDKKEIREVTLKMFFKKEIPDNVREALAGSEITLIFQNQEVVCVAKQVSGGGNIVYLELRTKPNVDIFKKGPLARPERIKIITEGGETYIV